MSRYVRGYDEMAFPDTDDQSEEDIIEETRHRRFLKAMALKEAIGLNDDERHELAQMIVGVDKDDGGSWRDLNPKQLHDLITMLEGYAYITYILSERLDNVETEEYRTAP